MKKIRVAIYARVSTEHEAQINALENQIQYYDDIMQKYDDWVLYNRYIDKGITGTSVWKRDSFMQMIQDAQNDCFDLIITREISRFARNTEDTLREVRQLRRKGIEVFFIEDNIWSIKDSEADLKITLYSAFAENESRKTSNRVKAGQKISFENGVFYGTGNILGYDYNKVTKEVTINEEQAETVKLIYDLYLNGYGSRKIQFELEKRGMLTAEGLKHWHCSVIIKILTNPFYCGTIVYRKSYIPDFLEQKPKKNKGDVEQTIVEGKHKPIISKEDFNKVQELLNSRKLEQDTASSPGKNLPSSVWSSKLVCKCGSTLNKKVYHTYKDGTKTYCYQCYKQIATGTIKTRQNKGLSIEGICNSMMLPEWKLQLIVKTIFNTFTYNKETIFELLDSLSDGLEEEQIPLVDPNLEKFEKKKKKLEAKQNKLLDTYLNDIITKENFILKKDELDLELKDISSKLAELQKPIKTKSKSLKERINYIKQNFDSIFELQESKLSDELINNLINKIVVYDNKFDCKLKLLDGLGDSVSTTNELFFSRLVITEDQIRKFAEENNLKPRIKNTISVDLYF